MTMDLIREFSAGEPIEAGAVASVSLSGGRELVMVDEIRCDAVGFALRRVVLRNLIVFEGRDPVRAESVCSWKGFAMRPSTAPAGSLNCGLAGPAYQSSQPGVLVKALMGSVDVAKAGLLERRERLAGGDRAGLAAAEHLVHLRAEERRRNEGRRQSSRGHQRHKRSCEGSRSERGRSKRGCKAENNIGKISRNERTCRDGWNKSRRGEEA